MVTAKPIDMIDESAMRATLGSGWFMALAVVFIILGFMAIVEPVVAGLAVTVLVGWMLMLGGWRTSWRRSLEAARGAWASNSRSAPSTRSAACTS